MDAVKDIVKVVVIAILAVVIALISFSFIVVMGYGFGMLFLLVPVIPEMLISRLSIGIEQIPPLMAILFVVTSILFVVTLMSPTKATRSKAE